MTQNILFHFHQGYLLFLISKNILFLVSKNILVYWDTQADDFRSFNISNIVSITNLSRTPLEVNKKEKEKIEREKKKGVYCLRCDTSLTTDYRNKFDSNYCGDC